MRDIGCLELEEAAAQAVGNWIEYRDFGWPDAPDPRYWTRIELSHRDSGVLDQSNAAAIESALDEVDPDGKDHWTGSASHWAVGYTNTLIVRVYADGTNELYGKGTGHGPLGMPSSEDITPAFRALWECAQALADYPILDDEDYSRREHEDAIETLENAYGVSAEFSGAVFSWLFDTYSRCSGEEYLQSEVDEARAAVDPDYIRDQLEDAQAELAEVRTELESLTQLAADYLRGIRDRTELEDGLVVAVS
jgi:hypothetical protein